VRVVRPWPRLPRKAVAAPSLAVFKARLGGALSSLVWWKVSLLMAGGLEPDDLQGPFQPKQFYDSMNVMLDPRIQLCSLQQGKKQMEAASGPWG